MMPTTNAAASGQDEPVDDIPEFVSTGMHRPVPRDCGHQPFIPGGTWLQHDTKVLL